MPARLVRAQDQHDLEPLAAGSLARADHLDVLSVDLDRSSSSPPRVVGVGAEVFVFDTVAWTAARTAAAVTRTTRTAV
jgi:hypothetical protein